MKAKAILVVTTALLLLFSTSSAQAGWNKTHQYDCQMTGGTGNHPTNVEGSISCVVSFPRYAVTSDTQWSLGGKASPGIFKGELHCDEWGLVTLNLRITMDVIDDGDVYGGSTPSLEARTFNMGTGFSPEIATNDPLEFSGYGNPGDRFRELHPVNANHLEFRQATFSDGEVRHYQTYWGPSAVELLNTGWTTGDNGGICGASGTSLTGEFGFELRGRSS